MAGTNLGTAYVTIMPSTKGIRENMTKSLNGEMGGVGESVGGGLGKNIGSALLKGIAALGIGAAVKKLFSEAMEAGGALQQSFGGLDTIYGDAAQGMKDLAYQAAQAGISANDYAEQAVSFGASLKQAFGGDATQAAKAANTAIMDMADNAAKMGTDMSSIQNAYQGFAKQNYTMLDNLKLGYGGTKTEMQRLLSDAEKLSGVKYDISNLGDVYEAIHVVQEELGLTGVAAQEGAETFTGSMGAMKASATNLLANLALGEDIKGPLTSLIENTKAFLVNNLFPMIGNIIKQLPGLLAEALKWAFANIPHMIDSVIGFINNLAAGMQNNSGKVKETLKEIGKAALEMFKNIDWKGLGLAVLNLIGVALMSAGSLIWDGLRAIGQRAAEWFSNIDWGSLGKSIIFGILNGLGALISRLWQGISTIAGNIFKSFTNIDWKSVGSNIITGIVNGINQFGHWIWDTLSGWASNAWENVKSFFRIGSPSKLMRDSVGKWIPLGMAEGIEDEGIAVVKAMNGLAEDASASIDTNFAYTATADALETAPETGGIVINVYPSAGMNERALADMVQQRLALAQRQKQAAWGMA